MNSTKYITRKKSKLKVVMILTDHSFFFKFENQYYFMSHHNDFEIKTKADAYKVINEQDKFDVHITTFKRMKELIDSGMTTNGNSELYEAWMRMMREDKLKKLEKDE